jgi:hypothetical protein
MTRFWAIALAQIATSLVMVATLTHKQYAIGLAVLFTSIALKLISNKIVVPAEKKDFIEVLFSITNVAVTFIILVSFGYSGIVHWAIISPLLITSYLITYMGLRIGIATKQSVPKPTAVEIFSLPFFLSLILLTSAFSSNVVIWGLSLADSIGSALLVIFLSLTFLRAKLAYTQL